jgi:hypothetical protein
MYLNKFLKWIKAHIVSECTIEQDICESHCRETVCTEEMSKNCLIKKEWMAYLKKKENENATD